MSNRLLPILGISCGALTTTYIGLMVLTIFFAASQTQAISSVRNTESSIGNLEVSYYSAVTKVSALNPTTLGYISPAQVEYVAEAPTTSTGLSFNGN
jgi:hypothetical protein